MIDVKELRQKKDWSKSELARRLGVNYRTVLRWEQGISRPSRMAQKVLEEIAKGKYG